jgi:HAD superfamily phosphoserine phosphatase-like hydrolase
LGDGVKSIVAFDMDGTLVRSSTGRLFVRYELAHGRLCLRQFLRALMWHLGYRFGWVNADAVARQTLSWYLGQTESEMRERLVEWFATVVRPDISEAARRSVAQHQAAGDVVVIATGSTRYVAELVAAELKIEHVVCSEVEIVDGRFTADFVAPLCFGSGKVQRLGAWIAAQGWLPGEHSLTFYTDSITDQPQIEAASRVIAVNPDPRLRRLALQRGYEIQRW